MSENLHYESLCFKELHNDQEYTIYRAGAAVISTITSKERILDGRVEIRNFSSSVEKYFTSERSEQVKYFFNTRREISHLQADM